MPRITNKAERIEVYFLEIYMEKCENVVNYRPQGIHTPSKTRRQGSYK